MSAYQVNKLCHRLYHDRSLREAIAADPAKAIADWPFSDAERRALLAGDVKRLYEWGAHPFLLGHINRWNLFGVTPVIYAERIKDARDPG
jgi:Aromatic-ring-opening dioxygenase LigAB, LigA subunit